MGGERLPREIPIDTGKTNLLILSQKLGKRNTLQALVLHVISLFILGVTPRVEAQIYRDCYSLSLFFYESAGGQCFGRDHTDIMQKLDLGDVEPQDSVRFINQ